MAEPIAEKDLTPKRVSETAVGNSPYRIFGSDLNCYRTVFGGRLLEIADRLAGTVAFSHSGETCVTLGLDNVRFFAPAREGDLVTYKASINRVWNSSLEIGVKVIGSNPMADTSWHVISMYFTFVAVDKDGKPVKIRPVIPESDDEKRRFADADLRRKHRLELEKAKLSS